MTSSNAGLFGNFGQTNYSSGMSTTVWTYERYLNLFFLQRNLV